MTILSDTVQQSADNLVQQLFDRDVTIDEFREALETELTLVFLEGAEKGFMDDWDEDWTPPESEL